MQIGFPSTTPTIQTVRQVTNRVGIANMKSGSNTRSGWRSWQSSPVPLSAIQVGIWNGYSNSSLNGVETGCGGPLTVALSVEYPAGTFTRLTWNNGATSGVIADNAMGLTDMVPLPVTIPANAKFRIAGDYQYLGGSGTVPFCGWTNACDRGGGDEYQVATTADNTMNSTVMGSGQVNGVFPQLVLGLSDRNVWGCVGDSIIAGVNDAFADPSGGRGLLGRALAEVATHLNYGLPGDRATWYTTNSTIRRQMMTTAGVTHIALELGINDVTNGRTAAQVLADRATIRGFFPGLPIFDTTLTPTTSSTDTYKTAANQTVAGSSSVRVSINGSLRAAGISGMAGVIDVASYLETSTAFENGPVQDGGVWIPRFMTNGDGTHPNPMGLLAVKPIVRALAVR